MADSFLGRWLGRVRPAVSSAEEAGAELERLATDWPTLRTPALWLRDLLPDLAAAVDVSAPTLDAERARAKRVGGVPLLRGETVPVDAKAFRRRWRHACEALHAHQPDGTAAAIAGAVRRGRLDPGELTGAVVAGRPEAVAGRAAELGLDPGLTATLLRYTLFPVFAALDTALAPHRAAGGWEYGYCPICGSWPLLGEFRGLSQERHLRCGLCAAGWEVPRLFCPYCGSRDHEQLGFLHREDEGGRFRAATCDACRGYVKMLSTLSALSPLPLLVADVATLHLDLAAAERGYGPP